MTWDRCKIPAADICWIPDESFLCDPCLDLGTDQGQEAFANAWRVASAYVYGKTCNRWPGVCFEERVRPCIDRCWCQQGNPCRCGNFTAINLWDAFCLPVQEITSVIVVGGDCCTCNETATWTPATGHYRLEWEGNCPVLVRQRTADEECCEWWPLQDLCLPDGGECTWSITARTGCDPPPDVLAATASLASEIVKECVALGCSPVQGASRVTTRGATYERRTDEIGSGFWWDMLRDVMERYECGPVDYERFVSPGSSSGATFHTVFGPRVIA